MPSPLSPLTLAAISGVHELAVRRGVLACKAHVLRGEAKVQHLFAGCANGAFGYKHAIQAPMACEIPPCQQPSRLKLAAREARLGCCMVGGVPAPGWGGRARVWAALSRARTALLLALAGAQLGRGGRPGARKSGRRPRPG